MVPEKKIVIRELFFTIMISGLSVLLYCFPRLSDLFVYQRQAVLEGEIWRLITAPLVHFSAGHFLWDTTIFLMAGLSVSISGFSGLWVVCCLSALIPGLLFITAFPDMALYGGLSGLATGAVCYYCLCNILEGKGNKQAWILILIAVIIKIFMETALNESIFAKADNTAFRVLPSAHITGYLAALFTALLLRTRYCHGQI